MPNEFDELITLLTELLTNRFSPKANYIRGVLGDGRGNVVVPGKPDRNYVRFNRGSTEYFEIFNRVVTPVHNWPVLIGELPWQPGLTQVVDTDWAAYEQSGWGDDSLGQTSPHAGTHEWPDGSPGSDPVDVHLRSIVPLRAYALGSGSTSIFVNTYEYAGIGCSGTVWGGQPGIDLSPVMATQTTGTARLMGVYLDPTSNSLGVVTGAAGVFTSAIQPPRVAFPPGTIPSARVRVYGGQVAINEADIFDARRPFTYCATGTVGGGGAPSGAAGGDLDGTYPNPAVDGLRGNVVADEAPGEGQVLMWTGSAWRPRAVSGGGGGAPSGPAGGDLTGTYPNPSVAGLFGSSVVNEAPTEGYVLTYTGSAWRPRAAPVNTDTNTTTPTGPAGGDLTGTYPNPTVVNLYARPIFDEAPDEGEILMWTGSAWRPRPVSILGGGAPTGPAGGDLTGSYPNPSVAGLYGYSLLNTAPSEGDILMFTGSAWQPITAKKDVYPPYLQINVLKTDGSVDYYTDLSEAIAGAASTEVVLIGPGTYSETATITIDKDLTIAGYFGRDDFVYNSTLSITAAIGFEITGSNIAVNFENLRIVAGTTNQDCDAIRVTNNATVYLRRCKVEASVPLGTGDAYCVAVRTDTSGAKAYIYNSTITPGLADAAYGILSDNNVSNVVHIQDTTINSSPSVSITSGSFYAYHSILQGEPAIVGSGVLRGSYQANFGSDFPIRLLSQQLDFRERSSDPGTPPTGTWAAYFKADGFYVKEDTGTARGPIPGAWTTFTPTVTQSGSVTVTVNYAKYKLVDDMCTMTVSLTVTGSGTAGNAISIGNIPSAAQPATTLVFFGSGGVYDVSASGGTWYQGGIQAAGASDIRFIPTGNYSNYTGVTPSFALASGDLIRFTATYEV